MGASGTDVLLSASALKLAPLAIECKNQEAIGPLYKFWEQTVANVREGLQPVLFVKKARSEPLVIIDAEYFFQLLSSDAYKKYWKPLNNG